VSDDYLKRVPPHDADAERSVIGAVLIKAELFDAVAEIVEPDDFYRENHRIIWEAIAALAAAKSSIDMVTLTAALGGKDALERVGGSSNLAECLSIVPAPSMAPHYARIVHEKSILRQLATLGGEIAARAYEAPAQWSPDATEEAIVTAEYGIAQIASKQICRPERAKAETLSQVLWNLEHGVENAVATGYPNLDRSFGGFNIGHVTFIAARTSKGKTALATNIALNAAKAGIATAYFTLEMTTDEMWLRALGCEARVDMFSARRRGYRDGESVRVHAAEKLLGEIPLEILYRPSMRPRDLRLEYRRLAREMGGLKLVIVDYFNLMRGDRRERERWREMQEAILALKEIAGELGIPLLVLSQLNRETNENEPPSLSNLRDTGAAEEHASNVLFVWQKPLPKDSAPAYDEWEDVDVIIAKQRNGPAGLRVPMQFRKNWGAFATK
jgi:replicative DNA helicase